MKNEIKIAITKVESSLSKQMLDVEKTSNISAMILSVCIVDCLSGFHGGYEGKGSRHKSRFNKFTKEYMPKYADFLYKLRSDLLHNFSNSLNLLFADNHEFLNSLPGIHTILGKKIFDIIQFKSNLKEAYAQYFCDVGDLENEKLRSNFMKRYKSLGLIDDYSFPVLRNFKGEIKSDINEMDRMPESGFPIAIGDSIKLKN